MAKIARKPSHIPMGCVLNEQNGLMLPEASRLCYRPSLTILISTDIVASALRPGIAIMVRLRRALSHA